MIDAWTPRTSGPESGIDDLIAQPTDISVTDYQHPPRELVPVTAPICADLAENRVSTPFALSRFEEFDGETAQDAVKRCSDCGSCFAGSTGELLASAGALRTPAIVWPVGSTTNGAALLLGPSVVSLIHRSEPYPGSLPMRVVGAAVSAFASGLPASLDRADEPFVGLSDGTNDTWSSTAISLTPFRQLFDQLSRIARASSMGTGVPICVVSVGASSPGRGIGFGRGAFGFPLRCQFAPANRSAIVARRCVSADHSNCGPPIARMNRDSGGS